MNHDMGSCQYTDGLYTYGAPQRTGDFANLGPPPPTMNLGAPPGFPGNVQTTNGGDAYAAAAAAAAMAPTPYDGGPAAALYSRYTPYYPSPYPSGGAFYPSELVQFATAGAPLSAMTKAQEYHTSSVVSQSSPMVVEHVPADHSHQTGGGSSMVSHVVVSSTPPQQPQPPQPTGGTGRQTKKGGYRNNQHHEHMQRVKQEEANQRADSAAARKQQTSAVVDHVVQSVVGGGAASSGNGSEPEEHIPHVLAPSTDGHQPRRCLLWACKACKKKTVTVDRRKAATMRERRRLRKVSLISYFFWLSI